jgi:hypothetical protein
MPRLKRETCHGGGLIPFPLVRYVKAGFNGSGTHGQGSRCCLTFNSVDYVGADCFVAAVEGLACTGLFHELEVLSRS